MSGNLRDQLQATLSGTHTLERELGGGGMSKVFVAEETRLKRKVVVKVLSPELAQGISIERFEREIQTAAALQHANIVPVITAGETQGLPYYTMPFVEGESLRGRLARGPLPVTEVLGILRDVTRALAYAHQRGVVHRDIKPDNVLLAGGAAVVTDFGIAKAISASRTDTGGATLTQIGTSIGTPAYMAPEQAAGDPDVDHRADIYALGAMAYELLSGQPVFANRTPQRMLAAHMGEAPKPIAEFRADLPPALADMVMQCLAKEADARPQQAGDIARTLETITSGSGMPAMPAVLLGGPGMFRKALAIYAAAFVVVAILAKAAIVGIGLPEWVFAGSLIVMALGLPVVLWTGYVQRVTRRAMSATPTFTPGGSPSTTAHGTIATMALKAAPHVSWYRTARGGMYAFGTFIVLIAAFMGMRAFGIGPFGSLLATGALSAREQVILADFRTTNTDTTLGRVVSDAVRAGLQGSSAFTIYSQAQTVAALERMRAPKDTQMTYSVAREVAQREGLKAVVDGEVTGVAGGYIVTLRLVRADSGIELASFRETGDGPRGLIDAADELARALRSKAGESLRAVNATPRLSQVTTSSLDALKAYGEAGRANALGEGRRAIEAARRAVALDSTFASGWSMLGVALINTNGRRSAIDSAYTMAFKYRMNVSERERSRIEVNYYAIGPGRDRGRTIAAYEEMMRQGDSGSVISLGERLRSKREFARAESLNALSVRRNPTGINGIALVNIAQLQINQGNLDEAAATVERIWKVAPQMGLMHEIAVHSARGDLREVRRLADSAARDGDSGFAVHMQSQLALTYGQVRDWERIAEAVRPVAPSTGADEGERSLLRLQRANALLLVRGADSATVRRARAAVAGIPFRDLPQVDRPYLAAAAVLAIAGQVADARAMVQRYRNEIKDTSLIRVQQPEVHNALGYIAIAEGNPRVAIDEFRRGDIGWDGAPADECAACLPLHLARAFDAAAMPDSAIRAYEQYLATPTWYKGFGLALDAANVPSIRERLGQLYEAQGNAAKAAENYRAFIELWKNADAELQPRVAAAKARLAKLNPVERPR